MGKQEMKDVTVSLPLGVTFTDFPDKENCAVIVYFSGCFHDCIGCQNPELKSFDYGTSIPIKKLEKYIKDECNKAHTTNIVFSGGDCAYQPVSYINELICNLEASGYKVCVYTGFNIKWISEHICGASYYKCGVYDERQKEKEWGKDSEKIVFVTKNQRLYNKRYRQISVENKYYFNRIDRIKAKIKWLFRKR